MIKLTWKSGKRKFNYIPEAIFSNGSNKAILLIEFYFERRQWFTNKGFPNQMIINEESKVKKSLYFGLNLLLLGFGAVEVGVELKIKV